MKVFDFTGGFKGKQVAEAFLPTWVNGAPDVKNPVDGTSKFLVLNKQFRTMFGPEAEVSIAQGAGSQFRKRTDELKPEDYGCEAILFCMGKFKCGTDSVWSWKVLATPEWIAKHYEIFEEVSTCAGLIRGI